MADLNKIQSAETFIVCDGVSQAAAVAASSPPGATAEGLVVREAAQGQQTMANSIPVVIASNQKLSVNNPNTTTTGTITALNGNVQLAVSGYSACSFQIIGTWVATIIAQISVDNGTTWDTVQFQMCANGQLLASSTQTGQFQFLNLGGVTNVRLQANAFTSGTVNVTISAGIGDAIETTVSSIYTGFQPDPSTSATGNVANLQLDNTNRLEIHGSVTSDEGSWRDDFSGTSLSTNWTQSIGTGGNVTVANSIMTMTTGVTSGSTTSINYSAVGDYLPLVVQVYGSISQRIANQTITFGLADVFPTPSNCVLVQFSGTTNTQATFVTCSSSAASDQQSTTVTLPNGGITSAYHLYKLDISQNLASLSIDGVLVATQSVHLPGPYNSMFVWIATQNTGTPGSTTIVTADYTYFSDWDRTQIDNDFTGEPLAANIAQFGGTVVNLGQQTMSASVPVVIASNQSAVTTQCYEPAVVNGTITSAASTVTASTTTTNGCMVSVHGTYAGVNFSFQVSDDGGTTYYPIVATRSDETATETSSGVLTANTSRMWNIFYGNVTNFRVVATAWTSGTATINISMTTGACIRGVTANGAVASAVTDAGNPVKVGGPSYTAAPTTVTTGQRQNAFFDTMGRLMVSVFPRQAMYNAAITITATTASQTLIPAQGAGLFSDLISFTLSNSSGVATLVLLGDGTVNYSFWLPAGATIQQSYFPPVSQGTANTAWMAQTTTSVSSVYVTAHFIKTEN